VSSHAHSQPDIGQCVLGWWRRSSALDSCQCTTCLCRTLSFIGAWMTLLLSTRFEGSVHSPACGPRKHSGSRQPGRQRDQQSRPAGRVSDSRVAVAHGMLVSVPPSVCASVPHVCHPKSVQDCRSRAFQARLLIGPSTPVHMPALRGFSVRGSASLGMRTSRHSWLEIFYTMKGMDVGMLCLLCGWNLPDCEQKKKKDCV
jgi:hypothetical protein